MSSGDNKEIIEFCNQIIPISEETIEFLNANCDYLHLKKNKYLSSPLDIDHQMYLITKGVVRGFIKEDGKEITTWICEENKVIGSMRRFGLDLEIDDYLQALEDTTLIAIPNSEIEKLYESSYEANLIARKVLEQNSKDAEERALLSRLPSAEKRYLRFVKTRSTLLGRIPLKYIASYLGMKLETLSRIRSKYQ